MELSGRQVDTQVRSSGKSLMLEIDLRVTSIWEAKAIKFDTMCQLLQRNQAKTREKGDRT